MNKKNIIIIVLSILLVTSIFTSYIVGKNSKTKENEVIDAEVIDSKKENANSKIKYTSGFDYKNYMNEDGTYGTRYNEIIKVCNADGSQKEIYVELALNGQVKLMLHQEKQDENRQEQKHTLEVNNINSIVSNNHGCYDSIAELYLLSDEGYAYKYDFGKYNNKDYTVEKIEKNINKIEKIVKCPLGPSECGSYIVGYNDKEIINLER